MLFRFFKFTKFIDYLSHSNHSNPFSRFHRLKNDGDSTDNPSTQSSSLYSKTRSMLNLGSFRSAPSFGSLVEEDEETSVAWSQIMSSGHSGARFVEDEDEEDEYEEEERRELERLRRRRRQSEHFTFGAKPAPSGHS